MPKSILVVDDSKVSRMIIRGEILKSHADWFIHEAGNADQVIELIQDHAYDAITLDVNMPGMDGITLANILRTKFSKDVTQIFVLTANIQDSIRQRAEALNCMFIEKPITPEKIKNVVLAIENKS